MDIQEQVQKGLEQLTNENVDGFCDYILSIDNAKCETIIVINIIRACKYRPFNINCYCALLACLFNKKKSIKTIFWDTVSILFESLSAYPEEIPTINLIYQLYLSHAIIFQEIKEKIDQFLGDKAAISYINAAFILWFAPELDQFFSDFFVDIWDKIEYYYGTITAVSPLISLVNEFPDYRINQWERLLFERDHLYVEGTLMEAVVANNTNLLFKLTQGTCDPLDICVPFQFFVLTPFILHNPTLIELASFFGNIEIFKYLLLSGANLRLRDENQMTVLQFAIAGGNIEIVRLLEANNASFIGSLETAVEWHRMDVLNWLHESHLPRMVREDKYKVMLFQTAIKANNVQGIKFDLQYGAERQNRRLPVNNYNDAVKLLGNGVFTTYLEFYPNAFFDLDQIRNNLGNSLVDSLIGSNNATFITYLVNYSLIKANKYTKSPLFTAIEKNNRPLTELLIENRFGNINEKTSNQVSPLISLIYSDSTEMALFLLDFSGINVNITDAKGNTPLHCAIEMDNFTIAEKLLQNPDIKVNAKNNFLWTPFHIAVKNNNLEIVKLLLGCKKLDLNAQTKNGITPLHLAAAFASSLIVKLIFFDNRLNTNRIYGKSAYQFAEQNNREDIMAILISEKTQ